MNMTSDERECLRISKMSPHELLVYVLTYPEYLTDSYYKKFKAAILTRATQLGFYGSK
jgi:hypothetical protein